VLAGHITSAAGAGWVCVGRKLRSSRQLPVLPRAPFLAVCQGTQRRRKDSCPILSYYLHYIHAITTLSLSHPSTHALSVILLFPVLSIHSPTDRPLHRPLLTTSTRTSRCHASPSAAQSSLSRTRSQDAPALLSQLHPRNTASSPSPASQSPHPNTALRLPPPTPFPQPLNTAVSLATCSNPTPARLAFGPACCICKDSAASQSQSPTPSCVPVPAFLLQPATISPTQIYCPRDLTATA
jgi:hypothetical protein